MYHFFKISQKMPQLSSDMKDKKNFLSRQMERELPGERNTFTKIFTLEPSGFVEMQIFVSELF